jgi:hypothetical protein
MAENITPEMAYMTRAAAHSAPDRSLRAAQRFQHGVTNADVAALMWTLEVTPESLALHGTRWVAKRGTPLRQARRDTTTVVNEAIRTGLVRRWTAPDGAAQLLPARVHFQVWDGSYARSRCLFAGEDLSAMRARLVEELPLVDCLECQALALPDSLRGL